MLAMRGPRRSVATVGRALASGVSVRRVRGCPPETGYYG